MTPSQNNKVASSFIQISFFIKSPESFCFTLKSFFLLCNKCEYLGLQQQQGGGWKLENANVCHVNILSYQGVNIPVIKGQDFPRTGFGWGPPDFYVWGSFQAWGRPPPPSRFDKALLYWTLIAILWGGYRLYTFHTFCCNFLIFLCEYLNWSSMYVLLLYIRIVRDAQ